MVQREAGKGRNGALIEVIEKTTNWSRGKRLNY